MIYNKREYIIIFYQNIWTKERPIDEYFERLAIKDRAKILKYLGFLRENGDYINVQFIKHIKAKIWELKVDFSHNKYRLFYFIFIRKVIIILHIFRKKTEKTPKLEISIAEKRYNEVSNNKHIYEKKIIQTNEFSGIFS